VNEMMKGFAILLLLGAAAFAADTPLDQCLADPSNAKFRVFQTQNTWNFLKLDTKTGFVWQVQWGEHQTVIPVSKETLLKSSESRAGRFTLCPTRNVFNFLLLDQDSGNMWSVQWSTDDKGRYVAPIFADPLEPGAK
jgi:hypothetical protein